MTKKVLILSALFVNCKCEEALSRGLEFATEV